MEKKIEPFADDEYELVPVFGRMVLQLHAKKSKRKKVEANKIPKIYEAIREGRDVSIEHAIIDGGISMGAELLSLDTDDDGRAICPGRVAIVHSKIKGGVNFSRCHFKYAVSLSGCCVKGVVFFHEAYFEGESNFVDSCFTRGAFFSESHFERAVSFLKTRFAEASFFRSYFKRGAVFDETYFNRKVDFNSSEFGVPGTFREAKVEENTVLRGLWNYFFRPLLWPVLWLFTIGKVRLPKATFTNILRINTNTVMDTSSNPRLKRYIDDEQWINSWRSNPKWRRLRQIPFWVWEVTSHCGRSIGLWAFWSALIAFVFGFLHRGHIVVESVSNWYTPFYFSVVTFTTLGFGDVKPADWVGQFWITIEVVLGYVMLGGLISIFANKFARRS